MTEPIKYELVYFTLMELSLLIRGLKLFGSLLNVISSSDKKRFIPASRLWGLRRELVIVKRDLGGDMDVLLKASTVSYVLAEVFLEGMPSNTMTLSARYVAMMKSCSTTNAVFFAWRMYLYTQTQKGCCHSWRKKMGGRCRGGGSDGWKKGGKGREPLDDPSSHQSLLGVQVGRRFVNQVNVSWFAQTQCEGDSLQLTTRQVLHLQFKSTGLKINQWFSSKTERCFVKTCLTSWSMMLSICIGFMTSVMNCGWV